MTTIDNDYQRLLLRNIEDDTRIFKTEYIRVAEIPILLENWNADGVRGMTAVFLTEHLARMDDAALRRFLTEKAGIEIGEGSITIVRREEHVFFNFGFEIK